jgi:hypothetical protein
MQWETYVFVYTHLSFSLGCSAYCMFYVTYRDIFCGIEDQKREKIKTERGVAKKIGRKEEERRQISSEVEDFKLSVTSLIPFFYLNLYTFTCYFIFCCIFSFST